jgi:hypothetical protein
METKTKRIKVIPTRVLTGKQRGKDHQQEKRQEA